MPYLPVEGVKVVEVAQWTFTPAAAGVLADWGADVIKVEHPVAGDAQRGLRVGSGATSAGSFSPIMEHPNRGKRSIGLAIDHPAGLAILYDLVRDADVFLTNFLPDARTRLKIDVDDIQAVNPAVIYVRGSGLGARGPEAKNGGFDGITFWGRMGSAAGVTPPDLPRMLGMPGGAYGDSMGGMTIAGGIAAALFARERTGQPSVVDVSLLSVGAWAMGLPTTISLLTGEPMGAPPLSAPPGAVRNPLTGNYETADGRWLALGMLQPGRYWADFCRHIDREDLLEDERFSTVEALMANAPACALIIKEVLLTRSFAEWKARFLTLEGQWAPIHNTVEVGQDPQLRANGFIAQITDADGNARELVANPVQFDETPVALRRAPQFAEHTDDILRALGLSEDELIALKIDGVVT